MIDPFQTYLYGQSLTTQTTFTFNGGSGGVTSQVTLVYQKLGDYVYLYIPVATANSGTGSVFMGSGIVLPAAYRPLSVNQYVICWNQNNGAVVATPGLLQINITGNIYFYRDGTAALAYTNSTVCGNPYAFTAVYYVGPGS